ncbi:hypothetical protein M501DRAFT_419232 [Patellaria atrata CBS 101060]|uniref:Uncharacterized protein n=1 Tax=Patellaria atrata CBS 101060 TaxID=1346257 RepID=A0A9P4SGW6_9PEZI|nr:hypothetical protein M501DRAFT_419232 [Patellaria atrata CBS 101060]
MLKYETMFWVWIQVSSIACNDMACSMIVGEMENNDYTGDLHLGGLRLVNTRAALLGSSMRTCGLFFYASAPSALGAEEPLLGVEGGALKGVLGRYTNWEPRWLFLLDLVQLESDQEGH